MIRKPQYFLNWWTLNIQNRCKVLMDVWSCIPCLAGQMRRLELTTEACLYSNWNVARYCATLRRCNLWLCRALGSWFGHHMETRGADAWVASFPQPAKANSWVQTQQLFCGGSTRGNSCLHGSCSSIMGSTWVDSSLSQQAFKNKLANALDPTGHWAQCVHCGTCASTTLLL